MGNLIIGKRLVMMAVEVEGREVVAVEGCGSSGAEEPVFLPRRINSI